MGYLTEARSAPFNTEALGAEVGLRGLQRPQAGSATQSVAESGDQDLAFQSELMTLTEWMGVLYPDRPVDSMARSLLQKFGNLSRLMKVTRDDFQVLDVDVLKIIRFIQSIRSGMMIVLRHSCSEKVHISDYSALKDYLCMTLDNDIHETLHVLFLNSKNRFIRDLEHRRGGVSNVEIYPREIIALACQIGATSIVLAHNHPCGDPTPSPEDIAHTRAMQKLFAICEIKLLDHIIIGGRECYSLRQARLID